MFEMDDETQEVENGKSGKETGELKVENSRMEDHKGKRKPRRRKGAKDRQGNGGDNDERNDRAGGRRKRRRDTSGKGGKMSTDTAFDI